MGPFYRKKKLCDMYAHENKMYMYVQNVRKNAVSNAAGDWSVGNALTIVRHNQSINYTCLIRCFIVH